MNRPQTILMKLDDDYTLLYDGKNCCPYNVAYKYDKEKNIWDSGNYCVTLEGALATYLRLIGCDSLKSKKQLNDENDGITYSRLRELALELADDLDEDSVESFADYQELTEKEKDFFHIYS